MTLYLIALPAKQGDYYLKKRYPTQQNTSSIKDFMLSKKQKDLALFTFQDAKQIIQEARKLDMNGAHSLLLKEATEYLNRVTAKEKTYEEVQGSQRPFEIMVEDN